MIPAFDAVRAIHKCQGEAMVLPTVTEYRYWKAVSDREDLDITPPDSMGPASSMGLGLALANPDKKIVVLDGDGSILMNLGSLVTIAGKNPSNLVHFVFQDNEYFTTGGQPIPGVGLVNLAGIAEAAGFPITYEFDDLEEFVNELTHIMKQKGPIFVCLKVNHPEELPPSAF